MKAAFLLPALMLAGVAVGSQVQATPPGAEVTVEGSIKPAITCTPSVTPDQLDYGDIATNDLINSKVSVLRGKPVRLDVKCSKPAKLSIQFIDSKQASVTSDADFITEVQGRIPGITADHAFGLGTFNSATGPKNIGSLFISTDPYVGIIADGRSRYLLSSIHGAGWKFVHGQSHFLQGRRTGMLYSFGDYPNAKPVDAPEMRMSFYVIPVVNSQQLDFKSEVNLDGKFTIEIRQL